MGRSTASCFKIIACGSDSVDHGDLQPPESKVLSARNGWSFRKRSARHRVLSTIISEAPSATGNESPDSTAANLPVQPNLTFPEKASVVQCTDEKDNMAAAVDLNLSDTIAAKEDECSENATLEESNAVLIQAVVRGYLARRMLLKQKKVIILQAAVRGHLVRMQAVGTLRCVLAIVKMQALVRARYVRLPVEGSVDFEKQNSAVNGLSPTVLRSKREAKSDGAYTYISVEKLLSNKFTRQLMESTPRTKPINIKCDPVKSDSSWKWLERWMSVSSVSNEEPDKSVSAPVQHEMENLGYSDGNANIVVPSGFQCEPEDLKSDVEPSTETSENLITYDGMYESSDLPLISHPKLQNTEVSNSRSVMVESGAVEVTEAGNQQVMHEFSIEQPDPALKSGEIGLSDASISNAMAVEVAGSECGTELSITSTLDSPDMSDGGVYDLELEAKILDATDPTRSLEKLGRETFETSSILGTENSSILGTELSYANIDGLESNETVQSSACECVNTVDPPPHEKKLESDESNMQQVQPRSDVIHVVDKSSPEVSPQSHVTLPESQTTPSRQVSLNSKKRNGRKIDLSDKKKALSADKSVVSTPNRDSPTQSSLKSPEEPKTGKRRKSFGSTKLDYTDQEPREGSNLNSLPSYMQPTKSAMAKALSTGSPRSGPDVLDKDIIIKNRPYHPGRNEREGSPRVQHSPSQALQNAKGNGTHSPQDRKWLR